MTSIEPPSTRSTPAPHQRSITRVVCAGLGLLLLCSLVACGQKPQPQPQTQTAAPKWQLTWSDEFNSPDGSPPDLAKWSFDIGGSGYGNNELESYTNRPANVQQRNGNLVITAQKEEYTGPDGLRHYTSGRIRTQGHFSQAYGRFEASIQLPLGKGIWPAFWMLGDDITTAGWPKCGEIDILETIGAPATMYSTLHGPGYSGANGISAKYELPAGEVVNTGFHLYAAEWSPNDIKFFFDDHLIAERTPADLPPGTTWVYDHPFFIILNLAVGGNWPGNPDETTAFPQQMLVNYVRVYTGTPQPLGGAVKSHQENQ